MKSFRKYLTEEINSTSAVLYTRGPKEKIDDILNGKYWNLESYYTPYSSKGIYSFVDLKEAQDHSSYGDCILKFTIAGGMRNIFFTSFDEYKKINRKAVKGTIENAPFINEQLLKFGVFKKESDIEDSKGYEGYYPTHDEQTLKNIDDVRSKRFTKDQVLNHENIPIKPISRTKAKLIRAGKNISNKISNLLDKAPSSIQGALDTITTPFVAIGFISMILYYCFKKWQGIESFKPFIKRLDREGFLGPTIKGVQMDSVNDGNVVYLHDYKSIIPLAVSYDNGKTWKNVDKKLKEQGYKNRVKNHISSKPDENRGWDSDIPEYKEYEKKTLKALNARKKNDIEKIARILNDIKKQKGLEEQNK